MSRCFPFPPPGYTRNTRVEDLDLLKKEKHSEKKHKKEKEKKDSKEKHEKGRSDGKHKEKKDKKEKHRDRKKEKDRNKGKHKSGSITPDEKRDVGLSGTHNLVPSNKNKDSESDRGANLADKRFCNGEQVSKIHNLAAFENKNNSPLVETKSFRNASELGQGSIHKERPINQLPHKNLSTESKEIEVAKLGRTIARPQVDGKEKRKEESVSFGRTGVQGVEAAKPSGSASVPSSLGMGQNRVGVGRDMEKKVGHRLEDKEKIRDKEVCGREQDKQKPIHKDKSTEKEKKSDEKVKVTCVEQRYIEQSKIQDNRENHLLKSNVKDRCIKETLSAPNGGLHNAPRDGNRGVVAPLNLGKRKDAGLNGSYDEHSSGPNKLARTTTSSLPQTENGRTLEPCQSSAFFVDGKQRSPFNVKAELTFAPDDTQKPSMNIKVDGKERKLNGTIAQQQVSQHPSQTTANIERKPHLDSKYLSQVLSVPKIDDWMEIDDQEWLFNSGSSGTRKPEVDSYEIDPSPQVWDKALWLEPLDVYALPYVIPR